MGTERFDGVEGIPTLALALSQHIRVDELKKLVALTEEEPPIRKADLAAVIVRHLEADRLRTVWLGLDELQHAAVAEVVHSNATQCPADRIPAKHSRERGPGARPTSMDPGGARRRCASVSTGRA